MKRDFRTHIRGFSLVEVMVAMTVLVLLVTLLSMTLSQTATAIFSTRDRSDVEARASLVFSIFGRDLNQSILRIRMVSPSKAEPGNDSASFYTERPGYAGDRGLSAVRYDILEGRLRRGATGQKFGEAADVAGREILQVDGETSFPEPLPEDIQEIAFGVVRMEIGYIDPTAGDGPYVVDWPGVGKATALVVTLVLAEDEAEPFLDSAQLDALEGFFPDATAGSPPLAAWHVLTQTTDGSLPPVIHRSLRAYQRIFPLL